MNKADSERLRALVDAAFNRKKIAKQTSPTALDDRLPPNSSAGPPMPCSKKVYATWAPLYRRLGYNPVPITPGTKACHVYDWQKPMTDADFEQTLSRYPDHGIGLVMGRVFEDGTRLAALDVDKDDYTPLAMALMQHPPCVRVGSRGVGIFVRLRGDIGNVEFRTKSADVRAGIKHSELLAVRKLIVIPPTIHPDTGRPYHWTGTALHEISFNELPIIEV